MYKVDIAGLNKKDVLNILFQHAKVVPTHNRTTGDCDSEQSLADEEVSRYIREEGSIICYIHDRMLMVNLNKDILDLADYLHHNGEQNTTSAMVKINDLKNNKKEPNLMEEQDNRTMMFGMNDNKDSEDSFRLKLSSPFDSMRSTGPSDQIFGRMLSEQTLPVRTDASTISLLHELNMMLDDYVKNIPNMIFNEACAMLNNHRFTMNSMVFPQQGYVVGSFPGTKMTVLRFNPGMELINQFRAWIDLAEISKRLVVEISDPAMQEKAESLRQTLLKKAEKMLYETLTEYQLSIPAEMRKELMMIRS